MLTNLGLDPMLRFKSRAGCDWDLGRGPAKQKATEPKKGHSQTTGLTAGKQTQALDSPLEAFVICAQGVCSFFQTPQQRHKELRDEGKLLHDGAFVFYREQKERSVLD